MRVDATNGRWYEVSPNTYYPSVTTILKVIAKGEGFERWLGEARSYEEAIAQRDAAGRRGTQVHEGITTLLAGEAVPIDDSWEPKALRQLQGFVSWYGSVGPTDVQNEVFVYDRAYGYAGTADIICKIAGETWLIDVKTSADAYPSYYMQVEAYAHAAEVEIDHTGILLLKDTTKKGWQLKETPDREKAFSAFLSAALIYRYLEGSEPVLRESKQRVAEVRL